MKQKPRTFTLRLCIIAIILSLLLPLAATPAALASTPDATFVVINTSDSGAGSLRQAIINSNAAATGPRMISFNISGAGTHTINLTSALPAISKPVTLDGLNQSGASCGNTLPHSLMIILNGAGAGGAHGISVTGGSSIIRGLVIQHFGGDGVHIQTSGNVTVECNYIGTNATGSTAAGNGSGVTVDNTPNNSIRRNLLSGNSLGVYIHGANAKFNYVTGNRIGSNAAGNAAIPNTSHGILLENVPANYIGGVTVGLRNIISGNAGMGIELDQATGIVIEGNYIGSDAGGSAVLANAGSGIKAYQTSQTTIGGATPVQGNVISGNWNSGVWIGTSSSATIIQNNRIGINAAGTAKLGNGASGVLIDHASNSAVGSAGAGNMIGGNVQQGVLVYGGSNTSIQANFIGTNSGGSANLGNGADGVEILNGSSNAVGQGSNSTGNLIAFNGGAGVRVATSDTEPPKLAVSSAPSSPAPDAAIDANQAIANAVLRNSIYSNGGLGIDLAPTGVTQNDPGDGDTGPNQFQNFPWINSATTDGMATTIIGSLASTPNTTYRIELFSNAACDPSGNGEGQRFLGTINITSAGDGNGGFQVTFGTALAPGTPVTATATDPAGNTSEFSKCRKVTQPGHGYRVYLPLVEK
jgi:hypothetical protein